MNAGPHRVSPLAWGFLLVSAAALLTVVVLASADLSWLDAAQLNPLSLRMLPRQFRVDDLWRDALPPLGLAGVAALATLWLPHRPWSHGVVQAVLALVAVRYFIWRATTLNTAHPLSLCFSVLLFGSELIYLLTTGLQLLPSLRFEPGLRSRQADHLMPWVERNQPSAAIWIPTYNEPERMVRRAILTCLNLSYTNRTIWVLDDGHRPTIAQLAAELGVGYLSREGNAHRKAGNLNHALANSTGEFIVVFDCDFMPFPDFLHRTLGFFSDEKVALVQTPQHYFQAEFHNRNLGLEVVMPSDLDYFFRYLEVIRDRANAVICCGTSYVVRRRALEQIGGYVTSCLIEDHQTSTKLLTRGWSIRYLNEVLSMGEVPRTFADFLDQRLRWMQGNIQIFFRPKELPIWTTLNAQQLSFYLNLAISLLTPLWRLNYLLLPLLSLILGFSLIAAPPIEYLAYGMPFVLLLHVLPSWLSNHHQFQFWNEVYESLFCVPGLQRMAQVLRHPFRIHGGIVTNKDSTNTLQKHNLSLSWPLLLMLSALGFTLLLRYALPLLLDGQSPGHADYEGESLMLSWNIYNAIVMAVALLACIDQPVRRASDRFPIQRIGHLHLNGQTIWGRTADLSETGAAFVPERGGAVIPPEAGTNPAKSTQAVLTLMDPPLVRKVTIMQAHGDRLGLQFDPGDAAEDAELFKLLYSSAHWFHRPRRLSTTDALLHALSTLWRADPIRRRFRSG